MLHPSDRKTAEIAGDGTESVATQLSWPQPGSEKLAECRFCVNLMAILVKFETRCAPL